MPIVFGSCLLDHASSIWVVPITDQEELESFERKHEELCKKYMGQVIDAEVKFVIGGKARIESEAATSSTEFLSPNSKRAKILSDKAQLLQEELNGAPLEIESDDPDEVDMMPAVGQGDDEDLDADTVPAVGEEDDE